MPQISDIKSMSDDELLALANGQGSLSVSFKDMSDDQLLTYANDETATSAPATALQPPAPTTLGGVASSFGRGIAEGLTTELPKMVGAGMEFAGSYLPEDLAIEDIGRGIKEWSEAKNKEWYGPERKRQGLERIVYEGSKMLAPSLVPGGTISAGVRILKGVGTLVKAAKAAEIAGDAAKAATLIAEASKAAKAANSIASVSVAGMFGLSQAQQTVDTANQRANALEAQGKADEAAKVRASGQGWTPIATGAIEATGEYFGTKYLGKLFRLDEAGVAKRGAKNLVADLLKTLGVEIGTEMGQQAGEAKVEKITGIRPEADPLAEALDVIGPTAFMTLLTGGMAGAVNMARQPSDSIDLLQEEDKQKDLTKNIKKTIDKIKREESRPSLQPAPATWDAETFFGSAAPEEAAGPATIEPGLQETVESGPPERPILGERPTVPPVETIETPAPPLPQQEADAAPGGNAEEEASGPLSAMPDDALLKLANQGAETPGTRQGLTIGKIDQAANEAATSPLNDLPQPTEAQKEAGNYRKGHIALHGLDISIENPTGSERSGTDKTGKPWSITMQHPYGYIKGTQGKDKDHIDVTIGSNPDSDKAYVIDQIDPETGKFDEHKTILGADSEEEAKGIYLANFAPGWKGLGAITEMPIDVFRVWAAGGRRQTKPVEYKEAKNARGLRTDERPVLRGEKGGLEVPKPGTAPDAGGAKATVRQRPGEGGQDLQQPKGGGGEAGNREGLKLPAHPAVDAGRAAFRDSLSRIAPSEWDAEDKKKWYRGWDEANLAAPIVDQAKIDTTVEAWKTFKKTDLVSDKDKVVALYERLSPDEQTAYHKIRDKLADKTEKAPAVPPEKEKMQKREASKGPEESEPKENVLREKKEEPKKAEDATAAPSQKFYIAVPVRGSVAPSFKEVEGTAITLPGFEEYNFFVNTPPEGTGYNVSEASTGLAIGSSESIQGAISAAVAQLEKVGKEKLDATIKRTISDRGATPGYKKKAEKIQQEPLVESPAKSPSAAIAEKVSTFLATSKEPFDSKTLFEWADEAYGGTQAGGKYTPKDAYDAMELGVNKAIEASFLTLSPDVPAERAGASIKSLKALIERLPTQTRRTGETDQFQQFSTPPPLAYLANWVANIQKGETYLEPSAGIGGLAVFGKNAGAYVVVNELSSRRRAVLGEMGFDRVFGENAEQINNILPKEIKPSVIVMNPPFSATAGRLSATSSTVGFAHVEQALKRLLPNGRAVIILGADVTDTNAFKKWLTSMGEGYTLKADIGISGKEYQKYGTTYGNQLLVIDKVQRPADSAPVRARVEKVEDAVDLLKGVRDERVKGELGTSERQGETISQEVQGEARPVEPVLPATGAVGAGKGRPGNRLPGERIVAGADVAAAGTGNEAPGAAEPERPRGGIEPTQGEQQPARPGVGSPGQGERPAGPEPGAEPTSNQRLNVEKKVAEKTKAELSDSVYENYRPQKLNIPGAKSHPGKLVESAAMSVVEPPDPYYAPNLPTKIVKDGKLSAAQLEAIAYAGQAHTEMLATGERRGYFIGDGTGVGKGREIAGILLDNWRQGRTKAIWVSQNSPLIEDAKRDIKGIGWDGGLVLDLSKAKISSTLPKDAKGIYFAGYDLLKTEDKKSGATTAQRNSRLKQLVDWFGKDYDGVIVFDEAHNMGNALAVKGTRGTSKPSAKALAGVELQRQLPNARIVYVSATGATEVMNLSYADRLGLWGEGTPFANKSDFVTQISSGGIAAMELVARDMKAMGNYLARSLSFDDVKYEKLEHTLTPQQREIYDEFAGAWQMVLAHINEALAATQGAKSGKGKSSAMAQFWGASQRFFNQVITSMQTPAVVNAIEKDLEAGRAVVLQIVNTNEAAQGRALARMEEGDDLEDLDLTPKEQLMDYVKNGFPVAQYHAEEDENGNIKYVPTLDSQGNPVENADAVALRERLLSNLGSIRGIDGPMEILLDHFGTEKVAEITGRTRRVVYATDENGNRRKIVERRSKAKTMADADAYMSDKKPILIFSYAGGTGRSYHADLAARNQRLRRHYLLQAGWRADRAIQGFGRSHRSSQKQAPEYILVTTDIIGQKRFISSIARRLDQLGALTRGQRETGSGGFFTARDNLESEYAQDALDAMIMAIYHHDGIMSMGEFMEQTGLTGLVNQDTGQLNETAMPTVTQFLNRLLAMNLAQQSSVFEDFSARLDANIRSAMEKGELDVGLETLRAQSVKKVSEQVVHTDKSGAETKYVELDVTKPAKSYSFDSISLQFANFYRNIKSGQVYAASEVRHKTNANTGEIHDYHSLVGPTAAYHAVDVEHINDAERYEKLTKKQAEKLWNEEKNNLPTTITYRENLITGTVLPIWDRLKGSARIMRVQTDDGERMIGRVIHQKDLSSTLRNIGAEASKADLSAADTFSQVKDHGFQAELANGWKVIRRRVSGENRIELKGPDYRFDAELERRGVFKERINYETRYFIPTTEEGVKALESITANRPVVNMIAPASVKEDMGPAVQYSVARKPITTETGTLFEGEAKYSLARKALTGLETLTDKKLSELGKPDDPIALNMVIEEAVLRLPIGIYLLNTEGRAAPSLRKAVSDMLGFDVNAAALEKTIRGLNSKHPGVVGASLTLGLEEVRLSNYPSRPPKVEGQERYSLAPTTPTLQDLKTVFKDQEVVEDMDGSAWVKMKNGLWATVMWVDEIKPNEKALQIGYGKRMLSEGETVAASFERVEGGGLFRLVRGVAGKWHADHENWHMLKEFGVITKRESGIVSRHIKRTGKWDSSLNEEENQANWSADEQNAPPPTTVAGKIWAKIRDFIDRLVNLVGVRTARGVKRDIETGQIYEREGAIGNAGEEQYAAAWHGSPHTFDRFDMGKIGTGEGAQAYGHGLYFTDKKEIADYYKNELAKTQRAHNLYNGERLTPSMVQELSYSNDYAMQRIFGYYGAKARGTTDLRVVVSQEMSRLRKDAAHFEELIEKRREDEKKGNIVYATYSTEDYQQRLDGINKELASYQRIHDALEYVPQKTTGHVYKVELAPGEDEYLLWDKPLSEQPETIKKALSALNENLKAYAGQQYDNSQTAGVPTGRSLYQKMISGEGGNGGYGPGAQGSSMYLHSLGIRGIKYLTGTSRFEGEGNYNYVLFSDQDVTIAERYAVTRPNLLNNQTGAINLDILTPGLAVGIETGRDISQGIKSLTLPTAKSPEHLKAAEILGSKLGRMNRAMEVAHKKLAGYGKLFDKMGVHNPDIALQDNLGIQFMSDVSQGRTMTPDMQEIADKIDELFEQRIAWLEAAGVPLKSVRENYFPGMWTDKATATTFMAKRPFKGKESFRKRKKFDDIMEGVDAGLVPISNNPIDLVTLKLAEMDRSVMANRALREWEKTGQVAEIAFNKRIPEGWEKINDKYGTVWGPPSVPVWQLLRELAKTSKKDLYLADFGKQVFPSALEVAMGADDTMKQEANALTWGTPTGPISIHAVRRGSGRSYSQLIIEKLLEDHEAFQQQAPTIYEKLQSIADNSETLTAILGTPTFEDMKQRFPVGGPVMKGYRIAQKPVADILNNYLSSSIYNSRYFGTAFKLWMGAANTLNQFQLGVLSAFHAGFTSLDVQISANANVLKDVYGVMKGNRTLADLGATIRKAPIAMGRTSREGAHIIKEWRSPSVDIPENVPVSTLPQDTQHRVGMIAKAAEVAGGGFKLEVGLRTEQRGQLLRDWYGGRKLRAAARSPLAFVEMTALPVMDWLVPRQKAGVFGELAGRIIEQNPNKTLEELRPELRQAWNRVDARLGQVRYERLFTHNMAKNFIQMLVRAPGWTGGTIAEVGGSAKDAGSFFREWAKTKTAPANLPDRVAYTAALFITVMAANGLMTLMLTGEPPEGMDWWAFRDGSKDEYGKPTRWLLPTYLKDIFAYWEAPGEVLLHKTHPILGVVTDIAKNQGYYRTEIFNEDDNFFLRQIDKGVYAAKQFVPFWMRGAVKAAESEGGLVKTLSKAPQKLLAPELGIMPATRAYTMTPFEKIAYETMKSRMPVGSRTKEQAEKGKFKRELEGALRRGDTDAKAKIMEARRQGKITGREAREIMRKPRADPTARAAKGMGLDDLAKAVAVASERERRVIRPIFKEKLIRKAPELSKEIRQRYRQIYRNMLRKEAA